MAKTTRVTTKARRWAEQTQIVLLAGCCTGSLARWFLWGSVSTALHSLEEQMHHIADQKSAGQRVRSGVGKSDGYRVGKIDTELPLAVSQISPQNVCHFAAVLNLIADFWPNIFTHSSSTQWDSQSWLPGCPRTMPRSSSVPATAKGSGGEPSGGGHSDGT